MKGRRTWHGYSTWVSCCKVLDKYSCNFSWECHLHFIFNVNWKGKKRKEKKGHLRSNSDVTCNTNNTNWLLTDVISSRSGMLCGGVRDPLGILARENSRGAQKTWRGDSSAQKMDDKTWMGWGGPGQTQAQKTWAKSKIKDTSLYTSKVYREISQADSDQFKKDKAAIDFNLARDILRFTLSRAGTCYRWLNNF